MSDSGNTLAGDASRRILSGLLVLFLFAVQGCAPQPTLPHLEAHYYPQCYQPFVDLRASQEALKNRTLIGAAVGGLGGAVAGVLVSRDWKGALVGGLGGLLAGGLAGYASGKMNQHKNDQERMRSYQADMNADMRNAGRVEQYSLASLQCYTREFDSLLVQYKAGTISKEEVRARYGEIREGMAQISMILATSKSELIKRDNEYRAAFAAEAQAKNREAPVVASLDAHRRQLAERQKKGKPQKSTVPAKRKPTLEKEGRLEIHEVDAELNARKEEAEKRTGEIEGLEATQAASASREETPSDVSELSHYYEKQYLDSVVRLEEAEDLNKRALVAMSNAARNAGIDMV